MNEHEVIKSGGTSHIVTLHTRNNKHDYNCLTHFMTTYNIDDFGFGTGSVIYFGGKPAMITNMRIVFENDTDGTSRFNIHVYI